MDHRALHRRRAYTPLPPLRDVLLDDFPLLNVARCPRCDGPMTIRYGRTGPYYQCRCPEPPRRESRVGE